MRDNEEKIKNRFASEKRRKTFLDVILQTLMLAKKRQGIRKRGKKESSMIGCDALKISTL